MWSAIAPPALKTLKATLRWKNHGKDDAFQLAPFLDFSTMRLIQRTLWGQVTGKWVTPLSLTFPKYEVAILWLGKDVARFATAILKILKATLKTFGAIKGLCLSNTLSLTFQP